MATDDDAPVFFETRQDERKPLLSPKARRGLLLAVIAVVLIIGFRAGTSRARAEANEAAHELVVRAEDRLAGIDDEALTPVGLHEELVKRGFDPHPLIGTVDDFEFWSEISRLWVWRCVVTSVVDGVVDSTIHKGDCDQV